ncbi:MAG: hypothetical protein A3J38_08900 [Gammaproteobacteria bacterium RIFCSPHIGHO2_12_FULL_45_9]|nr:MAG: hypothetical protein A3J38_08900 [Gammaproteobacteria bacterium RIFCSPHIGHO2_12_FULL_45_9]
MAVGLFQEQQAGDMELSKQINGLTQGLQQTVQAAADVRVVLSNVLKEFLAICETCTQMAKPSDGRTVARAQNPMQMFGAAKPTAPQEESLNQLVNVGAGVGA